MGKITDLSYSLFDRSYYNFVETRCDKGEGLRAAENYCHYLYSCDESEESVKKCKKLFPKAFILDNRPVEFLDRLLPHLFGITLFWLRSVNEDNKLPLFEELYSIRNNKHGYEQDVIFCDSISVIQSEDDPGSKYRNLRIDKSLCEYIPIFADTHYCEFIGKDSLLFKPQVEIKWMT